MSIPIEWLYPERGESPIIESNDVSVFKEMLPDETRKPQEIPFFTNYAKKVVDITGDEYEEVLQRRYDSVMYILKLGKESDYEFDLPVTLEADGKFRLLDGHHRSYLAVAAGKKSITVNVKQVSPLWRELEKKLESVYESKTLYQPIEHPWFSDWKVLRKGRFEAIINFLNEINHNISGRACADVGCCTGYLCREFSAAGAIALGFDIDSRLLSVAEHLNWVWPKKAAYYYKVANAIDYLPGPACALITCLSLLHHFLWKEDGGAHVDKFVQWIKAFGENAPIVVIDTTLDSDQLLATHEVPLEPENFMEWMKVEMGVRSIVRLEVEPGGFAGRPMYAYSMRMDF